MKLVPSYYILHCIPPAIVTHIRNEPPQAALPPLHTRCCRSRRRRCRQNKTEKLKSSRYFQLVECGSALC